MEKTIFSKKHTLIKIIIAFVFIMLAFGFAVTQALNTTARADALDAEHYGFEISTPEGFHSGEFLNVEREYPTITLQFTEEAAMDNSLAVKSFWYGVSDTYNVAEVDLWTRISGDDYNANTGTGTIYLAEIARDVATGNGGIYHKFMFFRSGDLPVAGEEGGADYYYYLNTASQEPMAFEICLDSNNNAPASSGGGTAYRIDSLSAQYTENSENKTYVLNSSEQKWISKPLTVTLTNNQGQFDNANFYYKLEGQEPVKFTKKSYAEEGKQARYYGEATIPAVDSGITSYEGEIQIYSTSFADPETKYYYSADEVLNLYYDNKEPVFTVEANTLNVNGDVGTYFEGAWAHSAITYTIRPTQVASGAKYSYSVYSGGSAVQGGTIQVTSEGLVYRADTIGVSNITFTATSGAGLSYTQTVTAKIDNVKPSIKVNAIDANDTPIVTMGSAPGSGYRVGYASDSITFTILNENADKQQVNNDISYYYSYDGETYNALASINNNYQLRITSSNEDKVVDRTYYFKIVSASGFESKYAFTCSVLKSDFYTNMAIEELFPNSVGWLKEAIDVEFTLPVILGTENEYEIHGYITNDQATDEVLEATPIGGAEIGYQTYLVQINRNINNVSYSFYVLDKAGNEVRYVTDKNGSHVLDENGDAIRLQTATQLKLDLTKPSANVSATINGTTINLTEEDWSASEVRINIIPDALISGVTCYPILENGKPSLTAMTMVNNSFSQVVLSSGLYSYSLVSGAGHETIVSYQVNIDTKDIEFYSINAETVDKEGNRIDVLDLSNPSLMIANNLLVSFNTNHAGHFRFYYATYTGNTPDLADSDYQLYTPGTGVDSDAFSMLIKMPEEGGTGYIKYAFKLESMATDANGNRSSTTAKYINIRYDVRDFDIEVNYSGLEEGQWANAAPTFYLKLSSNTISDVSIAKFQYKLSAEGAWMDIEGTINNNELDFIFRGLKYYFDESERNDIATGDDDAYASFNGTIYFRALNAAGHSSNRVEQSVKMDTSTPNPLYAINQRAGEKVYRTEGNYYEIYSNQAVKYIPTGTSGIFINKAPITYYYKVAENGPSDTNSSTDDLSSWTKLETEANFVSGRFYWLYATNGMRYSQAYKICYYLEGTKPTAEIVEGGSIGAQTGVLEFNWTDRAEIQLKIESERAAYIWYSRDGGEWEKVSETAVTSRYQKVIFAATKNAGEDFVIEGNLKQTIRLKITNLSGSEFEVEKSVIVRIDTAVPDFDLSLSTATKPITETDLSQWFSEAINIKINPIAYNPGGVQYTYQIVGSPTYERFSGTSFSTDDIVGFDGNGEITIRIRAQANANTHTREKELTFKIDKVYPNFDLVGSVKKNDVTVGSITSAEWSNADEILISKVIDKNVIQSSGVTYTRQLTNEPTTNWNDDSPVSVKDISTLVVTATSGAGLSVTKEFRINIDNQVPVINAGPIVNNVDDPRNPHRYYIDQVITFTEANLKSAKYNNFPLSNGQVIATNTVDNSNGGYVHIVIEDLAGNKAELTFYMTIFDLTVNTIELNDEHIALLTSFEAAYKEAESSLTSSRAQYFETLISRLWDRVATLEKEVDEYQAYLERVNTQVSFDLKSDYPEMEKYLSYFISEDVLIVYPEWQQNVIKEGVYEAYYNKLYAEYSKLNALMDVVRNLQKEVVALPATNIVEESDYQSVIRVYNHYQTLSTDQKAVFKPTLYTKLAELKRICEVYLLQDESTGVSIDGDKLVGEIAGVELEVVSYAQNSELFANAQKLLFETRSEGEPRKIVSIKKLGLKGDGAQFDTGEIQVTLPIPTEGEIDYTEYVYFNVYRLSNDGGTLIPIEGVMRSRDGKSVYFYTTSLSTYVLATTANVVEREESEKIYGSIGGIEIDATLLTYITFAVVGMFVIFVVLMLIIALRRRSFLRAYNRDHKNALQRRGIKRIPKGNAPPRSNPARPEERVGDTSAVYFGSRK